MRCHYCNKRIPLLRKLSNGDFCSDEHRLLFLAEQEKLALACLVEAQQRFTQEVLHVVRKETSAPQAEAGDEDSGLAGFAQIGGFTAVALKGGFRHEVDAASWNQSTHLPRRDQKYVSPVWKPQPPCRTLVAFAPIPPHSSAAELWPAPTTFSPSLRSAPPRRRTAVLLAAEGTNCLPVRPPFPPERRIFGRCAPLLRSTPVAPSGLSPTRPAIRITSHLRFEIPCAINIHSGRKPAVPSHIASRILPAIPVRRSASVLDCGLFFDTAQVLARIESSPLLAGAHRFAPSIAHIAARILVRLVPEVPAGLVAVPRRTVRCAGKPQPAAAGLATGGASLTARRGLTSVSQGERSDPRERTGLSPFAPSLLGVVTWQGSLLHDHLVASRPVHVARAVGAKIAANGLTRLVLPNLDSAPVLAGTHRITPVTRRVHGVTPIFSPACKCSPALPFASRAGCASLDAARSGQAPIWSECLPYEPSSTTQHPVSGPLTIMGTLGGACADALPPGLAPAVAGTTPGVKLEFFPVPAPDRAALLPAIETKVRGGCPSSSERILHLLISLASRDGSVTPKAEYGNCWPRMAPAAPRYRRGLDTPDELGGCKESRFPSGVEVMVWQRILRRVPARAAWGLMAVPLTFALLHFSSSGDRAAGRSATPKEQAAASSSFLNTRWNAVKRNISERAGLELYEDFRSGLSLWHGSEGWSKAWSYDQTGFVRTGPLALYSPSARLTDYRFEFMGRIEKKALGWAFRAKNLENYYAVKIVITRNGRVPAGSIVHYAVIDGKETARKETPLPFPINADTLYRVRMEIRGSDFTVSVQDTVVDTWSDDRLKSGGFGFFNSKGEQSLLRWVSVSHQYDALGRLCAFVAPYSLQPTKGE